jgi:hypothetical protein
MGDTQLSVNVCDIAALGSIWLFYRKLMSQMIRNISSLNHGAFVGVKSDCSKTHPSASAL